MRMLILPVMYCLNLLEVREVLRTYIETCQEVGTFFMQGVTLAAALRRERAAQVIQGMIKKINPNGNYLTNKRCFSCVQMGHFCLQCPAKQAQQNVCQLMLTPQRRLTLDGTMLTHQIQEGNFSQFQGNGKQGQPRPQTTIGAATLQNSSEQPQVVQDWNSVPPPRQY